MLPCMFSLREYKPALLITPQEVWGCACMCRGVLVRCQKQTIKYFSQNFNFGLTNVGERAENECNGRTCCVCARTQCNVSTADFLARQQRQRRRLQCVSTVCLCECLIVMRRSMEMGGATCTFMRHTLRLAVLLPGFHFLCCAEGAGVYSARVCIADFMATQCSLSPLPSVLLARPR